MMSSHRDVAVLGAGPAGVAAACALRRLGYEVELVGTPCVRAFEGLSDRTLTQLRECGLHAAAERASAPGRRTGAWGGAALPGGEEFVVDRAELDHALLEDAASSGITNRAATVVGLERVGRLWRVHTTRGALVCRVVIDARGRRAQRKRLAAGPALVAVSQRLRAASTGLPYTRVHASPRGWSWMAMTGRGVGCLQVITFPNEPSLRAGLDSHLRWFAADSPRMAEELCHASLDGPPIARSATAAMAAHQELPGLLPVGDASVAADPLCGHGMYEALRSSVVTAAAANSFLASGEWRAAGQFIRERAEEIWRRTCDAAAFHYGRQAAQTPTAFWQEAAEAYRAGRPSEAGGLPMPDRAAVPARIERRPVLDGRRIELRRVVVAPDAPRGVWKVDGVELAALLDFLRQAASGDLVRVARQLSCQPDAVSRAARWLRARGLLDIPTHVDGDSTRGEPLPAA